jgi:hypothetical protein
MLPYLGLPTLLFYVGSDSKAATALGRGNWDRPCLLTVENKFHPEF